MSDQSRLFVLFESALQDYEKQTGIPLTKHPLVEILQNCQSTESITAVLHEQAQEFNGSRARDKIMKLLKSIVSALFRISATVALGLDTSMVCL